LRQFREIPPLGRWEKLAHFHHNSFNQRECLFASNTILILKRIFRRRTIIDGGDDFDYFKWLRRVRQEEARLKSVAVSTSVQPIIAEPSHPAKIAQNPGEFRDSETADKEKHKPAVGRAIREAGHGAKSVDKPKKSLRQRLGDVCNAWDDFQENRDRDSVYGYLSAVFSIVKHYNGRRRTKKLMRCAYKFAGLSFDKNAESVCRCHSIYMRWQGR
jgi:hypothetical protein